MFPCEHRGEIRGDRTICHLHTDLSSGHGIPTTACERCIALGPPPNVYTQGRRQAICLARVHDGNVPTEEAGYRIDVNAAASLIPSMDKGRLGEVIVRSVQNRRRGSAAAMGLVVLYLRGDPVVLASIVRAAGEVGEPLENVMAAVKEYGL